MALDLQSLNYKTKSNEGVKMYFTHPSTGEQLEEFALVLGGESRVVKDLRSKKVLELVNKPKEDEKKVLTEKDLEAKVQEDIDLVLAIVLGLGTTVKNKEVDYILFNNKKVSSDKKDLADMFMELEWMKDQVIAFLGERDNFL